MLCPCAARLMRSPGPLRRNSSSPALCVAKLRTGQRRSLFPDRPAVNTETRRRELAAMRINSNFGVHCARGLCAMSNCSDDSQRCLLTPMTGRLLLNLRNSARAATRFFRERRREVRMETWT